MSRGTSARHRAPTRAITPLTEVTESLTDRAQAVGRTGAVLAMSSGLVTTLAAPAQTTGHSPTPSGTTITLEEQGDLSALRDLGDLSSSSTASLALAARWLPRQDLSASPDARVVFERDGLRGVPRPSQAPAERPAEDGGTRTGRDPSVSRQTEGATARKKAPAQKKSTPAKKKRKPVTSRSAAAKRAAVMAIAKRYVGIPYRYGGTTPSGFDCSGYVKYVFKQVGEDLPRTANQQRNATRSIPRSQARKGDLVAFVSGGRAYHIGIYAGNGKMYDSPRSGKRISKRTIWSAAVEFHRVIS